MAAIVAFVATVVGVEILLAWLGPRSTLVKEHTIVVRRALAEPAPDLLVMGDSVARGSILVSTLHDTLGDGITIRNDGLQGTGPVIAYFHLRRLIDAGKVPGAILYAPSPHTLSSTRMHIAAGGFCTWSEVWDLLRRSERRLDVAYGLLLRVSYTLKYREEIKAFLKGDREVRSLFRDPVLDDRSRIALYEASRASAAPIDFGSRPLRRYFQEPFHVAGINHTYLTRMLSLVEEHDIRIYWATPPCMERVYNCRQSTGFNEAYYAYLDSLAENPAVEVLEREFPIYPDTDFYDENHFDIPASMRYSAHLGTLLKRAAAFPLSTLAADDRSE